MARTTALLGLLAFSLCLGIATAQKLNVPCENITRIDRCIECIYDQNDLPQCQLCHRNSFPIWSAAGEITEVRPGWAVGTLLAAAHQLPPLLLLQLELLLCFCEPQPLHYALMAAVHDTRGCPTSGTLTCVLACSAAFLSKARRPAKRRLLNHAARRANPPIA